MAEGWTKDWERRIVNGVYPLRRFLGQSDHSVVFLTDYKGQNIIRAAIKILPANPALTGAQLAHWRTAATLSHPHLMRLLDAGRCQLGGHDFLFVVMDYAEQNLGQLLPSRALTPLEVRDLLPGTLDALAYLHGQNLVQGGLKPSNFLVVHDQLMLASDTVRPAGESPGTLVSSVYDPPEARNGVMSTAGDLWGLGITLVESLTQAPPAWSRESSDGPALPANLAPEFVDTVRRCLNLDPGQRPSASELVAQLNEPPAAAPVAAPMPVAPEVTLAAGIPVAPATPMAAGRPVAHAMPMTAGGPMVVAHQQSLRALAARIPPKARVFVIGGAVGILALSTVWAAVHLVRGRSHDEPMAPATLPSPSAPPTPAALERPRPSVAALPTVIHQEIPEVPRSARESVRGVIKIAVRVSVDRSGNVVAAILEHRASSRYFDRAATDAATKWKFAQAPDSTPRAWLLHFEFTRAGATAHATALR
jgi:TonB family protein